MHLNLTLFSIKLIFFPYISYFFRLYIIMYKYKYLIISIIVIAENTDKYSIASISILLTYYKLMRG
jgi:hypothetical protein